MKTNRKLGSKIPVTGVHYHQHLQCWLAPLSPLLKHVTMRTLALLMFLGVALLNTTDGKDAQTKEPTTEVNKTDLVTKSGAESSPVAPLIVWQFTRWIVQAFTAAVNDPSLIDYAKQQGTETRDLQTTPCTGTQTKTSTY
jgi:hypothetical protein